MTPTERAALRSICDQINAMLAAPATDETDLLAKLLPAIGGERGSDLFTARDLKASPSLAIRELVAHLDTRALGRLLRDSEGKIFAGYRIGRKGHSNVVFWFVEAAL